MMRKMIMMGAVVCLLWGGSVLAVTLDAIQDCTGDQSAPGTNQNDGDNPGGYLMVRHEAGDPNTSTVGQKSWIQFDISSLELPVAAAELELTYRYNSTETGEVANVDVYVLNDGDPGEGWDETTITWNNAPQNKTDSTVALLSNATYIQSFLVSDSTVNSTVFTLDDPKLLAAVNADTDGLLTVILTMAPDGHTGAVTNDIVAFYGKEATGELRLPRLRVPLRYECGLPELQQLSSDWLIDTIVWDNDMSIDPLSDPDGLWVLRDNGATADYTIGGDLMTINGNAGGAWRLDTSPKNGFPGATIFNIQMRNTEAGTSPSRSSGPGIWLNLDTRMGIYEGIGVLQFHVAKGSSATQYVSFVNHWDVYGNADSFLQINGDGVTDFNTSMLDIQTVSTPNGSSIDVTYSISDGTTTANGSFSTNRRNTLVGEFEVATILTGGETGEVDSIYLSGTFTPVSDKVGSDNLTTLHDFAWLAGQWLNSTFVPCWER
jgi:hypothetical protein